MALSSLHIRLRTLTPLWTGGVDGTMDRIHETGILGSLRWWYEAIVRGLGEEACDPTEHTCELSGERLKRYESARAQGKDWWDALNEADICDACKVFGTTGWRRRFRVEVVSREGGIDPTEGMFPSGRVHPDRRRDYRVGGWLLRGGYLGNLELRFTGEERLLLCEILPTLLFVEKWGALGPKTSIGYGVFEIIEVRVGERIFSRDSADWLSQLQESIQLMCRGSRLGAWWWQQELPENLQPYQGILPALTNMFFAKIRLQANDSNWWRSFREIRWLQSGFIPLGEALWTGEANHRNPRRYSISNAFPVRLISHWANNHGVFPLAPIVRTCLRYGHRNGSNCTSVCQNGESNWCKFIFGTVKGQQHICGYCGERVREDRFTSNNKWCPEARISLSQSEVIKEGKRIQSKIRVSWAYRLQENEWEFRLWGWLPEDGRNNNRHHQQRTEFLENIRDFPWQDIVVQAQLRCWFAKQRDENTVDFLKALLTHCDTEPTEGSASTGGGRAR